MLALLKLISLTPNQKTGALGALDLLSVSGLINYMGKFDLPYSDAEAKEEGIAVRPVLLQKGTSRLAMYGIGNVKDQRMHFELRSNRVRMYMPKDKDDWFNVLIVHQNRYVLFPKTFDAFPSTHAAESKRKPRSSEVRSGRHV